MAETAGAAPAQQPARVATTTTNSDVSTWAWLQQVLALLFPSSLAAKAALFALVVALLPLLPSGQAPRIWELPHLLLLGIIISYGVFGQKNADAEVAATAAYATPVDVEASVEAYVSQMMQGSLVFDENDGNDGANKDGSVQQQAWSSRYLPDDPLVVVADTSAPGTNSGNGDTDTGGKGKPLLLPVRKLKPAAAAPTGDMMSDVSGIEDEGEEEEEEELLLAPKSGTGYGVVREHAFPSPSSVLDADLTLSPSSPPLLPPPPPPPPFLGRGRSGLLKAKARSFNEFGFGVLSSDRSPNGSLGSHSHSAAGSSRKFRPRYAVQATRSSTFGRYDPVVPIHDDEAGDETLGEMVATSDSSFSSDLDDDTIKEENSCEDDGVSEDDGVNSCNEELFELATRPGLEGETETEVEGEVDRKADEFIAKFREQIRMQKVEQARR